MDPTDARFRLERVMLLLRHVAELYARGDYDAAADMADHIAHELDTIRHDLPAGPPSTDAALPFPRRASAPLFGAADGGSGASSFTSTSGERLESWCVHTHGNRPPSLL